MSLSTAAVQSVTLRCHPANASTAVSDVRVTVQRLSAATLQLSYRLHGDTGAIRVPGSATAMRCDELWRHTCAELFIASPHTELYCEFNFAPSTAWAAYEFTAYRQGMRCIDCIAPLIQVTHGEHELLMEVLVHLPASLAAHASLPLGLTLVIEDAAGQCSYWALAHGGERPDFHHRDGFILNV